jgi:hypothetical protein
MLFLFYLLTPFYASSQAPIKNAYYKVISFGEKIQFGTIENSANWTVSNSKENIRTSLSGNQINDYVFSMPGTYEITYSDSHKHSSDECNHAQFEERMTIQVNPIKMTFDFSKILFSDKIRRGSNCDQIFVTVAVNVEMKDMQTALFVVPDVMVAGVGSEIIAKPVTPEVILKNGKQLLRYQLSGVATKEAYLMFDFVDNNNNIQTYYQPTIVN